MKTNQTLIRPMGDFSVYQRTSDGMFNATALLKQWNISSGAEKQMHKFLKNADTLEFVEALKKDLTIDNQVRENCPKLVNQIVSKSNAKTSSSGVRTAGAVWMHPLLFIDFAMWINPTFKVKVLKFVYDQLIESRNEAGSSYRKMCGQIAHVSKKGDIPKNISNTAKAINIVVYGVHERQMRNKQAEEGSMRELVKLQEMVIELIENGYIKNYEGIRQYLLNTWRRKNQPKELTA